MIVSGPNSPTAAATRVPNAAPPPPTRTTAPPAPDAQQAPQPSSSMTNAVPTPAVPSVICPYGCGQWIPITELDSHELAHTMQAAQGPAGGAGGARGRAGAHKGTGGEGAAGLGGAGDGGGMGGEDGEDGEDDIGLEEEWGMDEAVAAAMAEEEEEAKRREAEEFEKLRAKYGFSNKVWREEVGAGLRARREQRSRRRLQVYVHFGIRLTAGARPGCSGLRVPSCTRTCQC